MNQKFCVPACIWLNFESEETGRYGRKLPDIDAAIGWIRDNIHHEDFSVDDSNQRLDRLREGLTTT
jgi:hypothetical protein